MGLHSGVAKSDLEHNPTAGRAFFTGMPMELAKAVGDAGDGGMILVRATVARFASACRLALPSFTSSSSYR